MNPVERRIRGVDSWQRRFTPVAFAFGVVKKFGDDNGGVLAASLTFTAFMSLFPLLLVLTTILGLIASHDPSVRTQVVHAVASQVPLIGHTLTENVRQLQRNSVIGLVFGLVTLLWGASGLAQAGLFTMAQVWNLPGPDRPGFVQRLGRSALFLAMLGGGVIATTLLAGLGSFGPGGMWVSIVSGLGAAAVNSLLYVGAFRILTPSVVQVRRLLPGAVAGGICYTILQFLGTFLVGRYLHSDSAYGVFATVLGLVAWIYLAVQLTIYAAEINVVLDRRLWPRSIIQPPLTVADRDSLTLQATQNKRRPEQHVDVSFDDGPSPADGTAASPGNQRGLRRAGSLPGGRGLPDTGASRPPPHLFAFLLRRTAPDAGDRLIGNGERQALAPNRAAGADGLCLGDLGNRAADRGYREEKVRIGMQARASGAPVPCESRVGRHAAAASRA